MSYLTDERISDLETIAGFRVLEAPLLRWDQVIFSEQYRVMICGEINQFRWLVWRLAWRAACHEDLRRAVASLEQRVGLK